MRKAAKFEGVPLAAKILITIIITVSLTFAGTLLVDTGGLAKEAKDVAGVIIQMVTGFYSLVFAAVVAIIRQRYLGHEDRILISKLACSVFSLFACLVSALFVYLTKVAFQTEVTAASLSVLAFFSIFMLVCISELVILCIERMREEANNPLQTDNNSPSASK